MIVLMKPIAAAMTGSPHWQGALESERCIFLTQRLDCASLLIRLLCFRFCDPIKVAEFGNWEWVISNPVVFLFRCRPDKYLWGCRFLSCDFLLY